MTMRRKHFVVGAILHFFFVTMCDAHDLWIETNTSFVRNKEVVNVAFKLGNCDEGRRDFKTKGLIDKDGTVVESISPSQQRVDLTSSLARSSNDPRGGYWTSVCPVDEIGTNWFTQSLDQVIEHDGKEMRGIVTAINQSVLLLHRQLGYLNLAKLEAQRNLPSCEQSRPS